MENSDDKDESLWIYTNKWIKILKNDIVYCETNSDNTLYYMVEGIVHNASHNLSETERAIHCKQFCRISSHHMVNLAWFDEFSFKTHILLLYYYRDAQLKVSPLFMEDFLKKLENKRVNLDRNE